MKHPALFLVLLICMSILLFLAGIGAGTEATVKPVARKVVNYLLGMAGFLGVILYYMYAGV